MCFALPRRARACRCLRRCSRAPAHCATRRAPTRYHTINAFVVTDIAHDQLSLGYEGTLLDLRQEASGKFLSATLRDVQAFVIELEATGIKRHKVPRRDPIPFMVLEAENVKNVALALYFDAKAAAAVTPEQIDKMSEAERKALEDALVAALGSSPEERAAAGARAMRAVQEGYSFAAHADAWVRAVGLPASEVIA